MKSGMQLVGTIFLSTIVTASTFGQYKESGWEARYKWQKVDVIFNVMGVKSGDRVADIGCHEGFLTIPLAKEVGKAGTVYAVDVEQKKLDGLSNNLKKRNLNNVKLILGEEDDPKLPKEEINSVVILDAYHEMYDYQKILGHVFAALKPGGKIVIIDEIDSKRKGLSRSRQMSAHRLELKYAASDLEEAGFIIERKIGTFVWWEDNKDKPKLWLLVGVKP